MEIIMLAVEAVFKLIITIACLPVLIPVMIYRRAKGKSNIWLVNWILSIDEL